MATRKMQKFIVTRTDEYLVDVGEFPPAVIAKLIDDASQAWVPSLFIGETDYALGDGADFGAATNIEIEVSVDGA